MYMCFENKEFLGSKDTSGRKHGAISTTTTVEVKKKISNIASSHLPPHYCSFAASQANERKKYTTFFTSLYSFLCDVIYLYHVILSAAPPVPFRKFCGNSRCNKSPKSDTELSCFFRAKNFFGRIFMDIRAQEAFFSFFPIQYAILRQDPIWKRRQKSLYST